MPNSMKSDTINPELFQYRMRYRGENEFPSKFILRLSINTITRTIIVITENNLTAHIINSFKLIMVISLSMVVLRVGTSWNIWSLIFIDSWSRFQLILHQKLSTGPCTDHCLVWLHFRTFHLAYIEQACIGRSDQVHSYNQQQQKIISDSHNSFSDPVVKLCSGGMWIYLSYLWSQ